ncbi:hypothetical protein [Myxococcus stipitatus]|uniref:hypothetical protein n=1 Tax=Myxococcus stipitatus TaxID=83455 RepID=UPI0030CB2554
MLRLLERQGALVEMSVLSASVAVGALLLRYVFSASSTVPASSKEIRGLDL